MLPDSDMLKALHSYSSHFYAALATADDPDRGSGRAQENIDEHSMDETALLAFGILLEEAGREVLGKKGDLVFTEGVADDAGDNDEGQLGGFGGTAVGFLDTRKPSRLRREGRPTVVKTET